MQLLIHTGLNKTGSSYLQTVLFLNRDMLIECGIYQPRSPWDGDMAIGNISPGNGHEIAQALVKEDVNNIVCILKRYVQEAKNCGCDKVFLSNEFIIRIFSDRFASMLFNEAVTRSGFSSLKCWAVFRPFHDHALSLYKHRAKDGSWANYKEWFQKDYETLRLLRKFFLHIDDYNWNWVSTRYTRDFSKINEFLADFFGVKYLQLSLPEIGVVNESLSLNELKLLQLMDKNTPGLGSLLHKEFLSKVRSRADSIDLRNEFNSLAAIHIQEYDETIRKICEYLNMDYHALIGLDVVASSTRGTNLVSAHWDICTRMLERRGLRILVFISSVYRLIHKIIYRKKYAQRTKYGGSIRFWNYNKVKNKKI